MQYDIAYHQSALDALDRLSPEVARRILRKIDALRNGLSGNVKRLRAHVPTYRLRVGDWRVLFEVKSGTIIIHEVRHRSVAYDG